MKSFKILAFLSVLCFSAMSYAAKVDSLEVASTAMSKTYKAAVVLPNSYAKSKNTFSVLYLLHGAYGHFGDWLKNTPNKELVKNLADQYNIIIVMPEGETFSFYLDSPVNKRSQFETYITQEVIQKVDKTYRTLLLKMDGLSQDFPWEAMELYICRLNILNYSALPGV